MKNLYNRIGMLEKTDDRSAIERAIANTFKVDSTAAKAAAHVLLDPDRKAVYDRAWVALVRVGQLRANLGLTRAPNWLVSDCSDFDTVSSSASSAPHTYWTGHRQAPTKEKGNNRRRWIRHAVVLIAAGPPIIGGMMVLQSELNGPRSAEPPLMQGPARTDPSQSSPASGAASPSSKGDEIVIGLEHAAGRSSAPTSQYGRSIVDPSRVSPSVMRSTSPAEARAERVRKLVTKRLARGGRLTNMADIETAVQKVLLGQGDALPATGVMTTDFYSQAVAPLEIITKAGSNYYIKVIDWMTKAEVMTAFVRGGQPFETKVPLGSYEIRYAAGQSWYGSILDFGEIASYSRCDDRFDFTQTLGGYNGYTIELILQQNGNLQTDVISAEDF